MPLAKAGKALRRRKQSQDTWCRKTWRIKYFWAEEIFILFYDLENEQVFPEMGAPIIVIQENLPEYTALAGRG